MYFKPLALNPWWLVRAQRLWWCQPKYFITKLMSDDFMSLFWLSMVQLVVFFCCRCLCLRCFPQALNLVSTQWCLTILVLKFEQVCLTARWSVWKLFVEWQTVQTLIKLLHKSSLIWVYTVCFSMPFWICWENMALYHSFFLGVTKFSSMKMNTLIIQ